MHLAYYNAMHFCFFKKGKWTVCAQVTFCHVNQFHWAVYAWWALPFLYAHFLSIRQNKNCDKRNIFVLFCFSLLFVFMFVWFLFSVIFLVFVIFYPILLLKMRIIFSTFILLQSHKLANLYDIKKKIARENVLRKFSAVHQQPWGKMLPQIFKLDGLVCDVTNCLECVYVHVCFWLNVKQKCPSVRNVDHSSSQKR